MVKIPVSESTKTEFLKELRALLEKYNASINFSYEGDTHGITDENVTIDIFDTTILKVDGSYLTPYEIKQIN